MQKIINFLISNRNTLLYLVLMVLALIFTIQSHNYHRSVWIHSTGNVQASLLGTRSNFYDYFNLADRNKRLMQENAYLRMQLLKTGDTALGSISSRIFQDSIPYTVHPARVIKNDYHRKDNFITIDIGSKQGVRPDMGVISAGGIVGLVDKVQGKYSRVISILNSNISLNAQVKGTNTIGSLTWSGDNPYVMNLVDVPRLAQIKKGDTILTGVQSRSFPPDILIGTIKNIKLIESGSRYEVEVTLFNDMTDLGYVNVIKKRDQEVIRKLDTITTSDEQ